MKIFALESKIKKKNIKKRIEFGKHTRVVSEGEGPTLKYFVIYCVLGIGNFKYIYFESTPTK